MNTVTTVAIGVLILSGALCLVRIIRPGSLADRIVALDSLLLVSASVVAVMAARTGSGAFLNVLFVAALIAFVGTVTVARFMERRGA